MVVEGLVGPIVVVLKAPVLEQQLGFVEGVEGFHLDCERLTRRDVAPGALLVRVLARFKRRDEKYVPAPASGTATRPDTRRRGPVPTLPTPADFRSRALSRFRQTATACGVRKLGSACKSGGSTSATEFVHRQASSITCRHPPRPPT